MPPRAAPAGREFGVTQAAEWSKRAVAGSWPLGGDTSSPGQVFVIPIASATFRHGRPRRACPDDRRRMAYAACGRRAAAAVADDRDGHDGGIRSPRGKPEAGSIRSWAGWWCVTGGLLAGSARPVLQSILAAVQFEDAQRVARAFGIPRADNAPRLPPVRAPRTVPRRPSCCRARGGRSVAGPAPRPCGRLPPGRAPLDPLCYLLRRSCPKRLVKRPKQKAEPRT